jgi:hypothetical protein
MPLHEGTNQDWQRLLREIEEERVVPVVGAELLKIESGGEQVSLYAHLAQRLADKLGVEPAPSLDSVARRYLERGTPEEHKLYESIHGLLREMEERKELTPPRSLVQLAAIEPFKLFITTTFDSLLETAIRRMRLKRTEGEEISFVFSLRDPDDIPVMRHRKQPVLYYLLGRVSTLGSYYTVTDEDILEFVHCLPERAEQLPNLFATLKLKHLLLVGCAYPDWLERFFIRLIKNERLLESSLTVFVDNTVRRDGGLADFLRHFSREFIVFDLDPTDLVERLFRDWTARHPLPHGKVFLSYARTDREKVKPIEGALTAAKVDVWIDFEDLRAGEKWREEIERSIHECSVFVPIISANTADTQRYVWLEWRRAAEVKATMVPLTLDGSPLPAFFGEEHTLQDPTDRVRFVQRVKELYELLGQPNLREPP